MEILLAFLSPNEGLMILAVVVLLFGATKIPALMRSRGTGINQFKKGLKEGEEEGAAEEKKEPEQAKPAEPEKK